MVSFCPVLEDKFWVFRHALTTLRDVQLKGGNFMKVVNKLGNLKFFIYSAFLLLIACAGSRSTYIDPNMDFGTVKSVAVMPFMSLAKDPIVAERVRDVFINRLLATGAVYVVPVGEVARGVTRAELQNPSAPSPEEAVKLGGIIKVQAVITGTVREYGEVRSGTSSGNIISVSLQMIETQTGKVVWTDSSTRGGISIWDRLFGGGGKPMNKVTEKAINDLIHRLLK
jgi:polysaccharide biosynthesis protein PelC